MVEIINGSGDVRAIIVGSGEWSALFSSYRLLSGRQSPARGWHRLLLGLMQGQATSKLHKSWEATFRT